LHGQRIHGLEPLPLNTFPYCKNNLSFTVDTCPSMKPRLKVMMRMAFA
jgi:hypothetical protein